MLHNEDEEILKTVQVRECNDNGIRYSIKDLEEITSSTYCSKCGNNMQEGSEIHDGLYHYCSDECLYTIISEKEYIYLHEEGYAFWTTFGD